MHALRFLDRWLMAWSADPINAKVPQRPVIITRGPVVLRVLVNTVVDIARISRYLIRRYGLPYAAGDEQLRAGLLEPGAGAARHNQQAGQQYAETEHEQPEVVVAQQPRRQALRGGHCDV